jgi:hypothetical protein
VCLNWQYEAGRIHGDDKDRNKAYFSMIVVTTLRSPSDRHIIQRSTARW